MRRSAAIVIVGVAVAGAVYLGSVKLGHALPGASCRGSWCLNGVYARPVAARADWQIPVAILIAALGFAAAVAAGTRRSP